MSVTHELKTWPEPFRAVWIGEKTHEIRRNFDRTFAVGDWLDLREWSPETLDYTGARVFVEVTYKSAGGTWGLPGDIDVLSIEVKYRSGVPGGVRR